MKKKSFTLIEMTVVLAIVGLVFVTIVSVYFKMIKIKIEVQAKQSLIQNSYALFEKLNLVMKDYMIDYEEYFNRKMVGCNGTTGDNFSWSGNDIASSGHCLSFTNYGNGNNIAGVSSGNWQKYYCSSSTNGLDDGGNYSYDNYDSTGGCANGTKQSYGVYRLQFMDVGMDTDGEKGVVGDDDDQDLGAGPISIGNNTGVQELYLISKDKKNRMFLRRSFLATGDFNKDGKSDLDIENLYGLQMLKLKGFDAGNSHDHGVGLNTGGLYDSWIDTWACDGGEGFTCNGNSINYAGSNTYKLPANLNDGWVDFWGKDITIVDWNMQIFPSKDPEFAWDEQNYQINPYIKINLRTKLYGGPWSWKINPTTMNQYDLSLQTIFNTKSFY